MAGPISPFEAIFGDRWQALSRVRNIKCPNRSIDYHWPGLYGALRSFTQQHWSAVGVQSIRQYFDRHYLPPDDRQVYWGERTE